MIFQKIRTSFLHAFILLAFFPAHAQFNPTSEAPKYRIQATQSSPRDDLSAELLMLPPGEPVEDKTPVYQHWIVDRRQRAARQLLHSGDWPSTVYFSPDEFIIAMQV